MAITMKELFTNLKAGDMFLIPLPDDDQTYKVTVLRITPEGGIFLSWPHEMGKASVPGPYNPHTWSDELQSLVDCDGETPPWYSEDIVVERDGASDEAAVYAQVPRIEHLEGGAMSDAEFMAFTQTPDFRIMCGIVTNEEQGDLDSQLLLALQHLGVELTSAQRTALIVFATTVSATRTVNLGLALVVRDQPGKKPEPVWN